MKRIINNKYYRKFRELVLYGIIGGFSSTLDFIVYTLLIKYFGVYYLIANIISVITGISTSFILNRQYNFKVKDHTFRRFMIFFTVGMIGLGISSLILYICISEIGINPLLSKLLSIVLVVVIQFLLNKYVTFKSSEI